MAIAKKGDPLKKRKDSLNFRNKTVEKYSERPSFDDLDKDDMARGLGREKYEKDVKHMKKIGLKSSKKKMPYFEKTGSMVSPSKIKNPMDKR
tara:strand:+ start:509 stop:784 length:276 start_codon:yes stop_codon:yes gene_type:complete